MTKPTLRSMLPVLGLAMVLAATDAQPALAADTTGTLPGEVWRYLQVLERVCETRVTPELVRLHQEAVKAFDTAKYGGGRDSNFFGVRTPEHAYVDCFQADGEVR